MKAKFLGDPERGGEGPRVLRIFGRVFPKGRFVTIDGADADAVFAKLAANSHFETGEGEGEADLTPIEPDVTDAELTGEEHGGAPGPAGDKAEIIARLEAIQLKHPEVEFDRRWGEPKLRAALEAAEFEHDGD